MPTSIDVFAKAREYERLEQLKAARELGALPYFHVLEGPTLPVVEMEGAKRIMLGSNNYLGLTGDPRVREGARSALERYGTGLTGSRFLNGTIDLHVQLERELAEWLGTEDAIVFTTGHQANLGALGTILGPGDTVIADSGDHASILDGCILSRAKIGSSSTTGSSSWRSSCYGLRPTVAACWSSSTASTRWRATLPRWSRSRNSAPGSARA